MWEGKNTTRNSRTKCDWCDTVQPSNMAMLYRLYGYRRMVILVWIWVHVIVEKKRRYELPLAKGSGSLLAQHRNAIEWRFDGGSIVDRDCMLGGLIVVSPKWPTEQWMLLSRMIWKVFFFSKMKFQLSTTLTKRYSPWMVYEEKTEMYGAIFCDGCMIRAPEKTHNFSKRFDKQAYPDISPWNVS